MDLQQLDLSVLQPAQRFVELAPALVRAAAPESLVAMNTRGARFAFAQQLAQHFLGVAVGGRGVDQRAAAGEETREHLAQRRALGGASPTSKLPDVPMPITGTFSPVDGIARVSRVPNGVCAAEAADAAACWRRGFLAAGGQRRQCDAGSGEGGGGEEIATIGHGLVPPSWTGTRLSFD